jgi:excisionase family DNA binding protein
MPKNEFLLRSRDVAHILDMSPDDVIMLARQGKIRAQKIGRLWRFRLSDVTRYRTKLAKAAA